MKLNKIFLWIFFISVIKLVGITNPPLEHSHSWRQCFTLTVTKNLQQDLEIFKPKVNILGKDDKRVIASEFPIYNLIIIIFNKLFGFAHWYGRLVNVIFSALGLIYFFLLINKIVDYNTAFYSTIILSVSEWFMFSRKIMPDVFSLSLIIISLYYAYLFLTTGKKINLIIYILLSTLGALAKLPSLLLLSSVGIVLFLKVNKKRKSLILLSTTIPVMFAYFWYFIWGKILIQESNIMLFFPKSIAEGFREWINAINLLLDKFYFAALRSFIAFFLFLYGIFLIFKHKSFYLKIFFITTLIVLFIFMIKTGDVFAKHTYYILPYIPIMAFISGYALAKIPEKYGKIIILIIIIEGIANQYHDLFVPESKKYRLELSNILDSLSISKKDRIIINGGLDYQDIYFTERQGWSLYNHQLTQQNLDSLIYKRNAKYIIINKHNGDTIFNNFTQIFENKHYRIFATNVIKHNNK